MQGDGLTAEVLVPSDRARDLLGSDQDHEDRGGAHREAHCSPRRSARRMANRPALV